jgi:hypothetical protein
MTQKTSESDAETWHLPLRPIAVPADVQTALERSARDAFLAQHAPGDRRPLSIFSGRGGDAEYGR